LFLLHIKDGCSLINKFKNSTKFHASTTHHNYLLNSALALSDYGKLGKNSDYQTGG